jgi:peptide/nickel transport system permease protein
VREGQRASTWRDLLGERRAALALTVLIVLIAFSAIGPLLHPVDPNLLELSNAAASPSATHPLGTDESGRDILARLMHGGRVSLAVGLAAVVCSLVVGVTLGAAAGFRRGATDGVLMRLTDAMLSVPTIFLIITAMTFIGPSVTGLVIAIGMTSWMGLARLVRGEILALREQSYVEAWGARRARGQRIVCGDVLPQHVAGIIV